MHNLHGKWDITAIHVSMRPSLKRKTTLTVHRARFSRGVLLEALLEHRRNILQERIKLTKAIKHGIEKKTFKSAGLPLLL